MVTYFSFIVVAVVTAVSTFSCGARGFFLEDSRNTIRTRRIKKTESIFKLYGRKVKRRNLGNAVADDGDNKVATTSDRTAPKQRSKRVLPASKKNKKKDANSASVAKTKIGRAHV